LAIGDLQYATLLSGNTATFDGYFGSLVGVIGASTSNAETSARHQTSLVEQLENRREQISGVSVDEEMTDLMKFQHAYEASARMITVVDEMLDTIIGMV